MISGYDSPLYRDTLEHHHGWRCVEFVATSRHGLRLECVWFNFAAPAQLHDPRYVGDNYRERERIKRKRNRWRARFAKMSAGERQVIFEALAGVRAENDRLNDLDPTRYPNTPENGGTGRARKVVALARVPHTIDAFDEPPRAAAAPANAAVGSRQ